MGKKITQEEWVERASLAHNNEYDYSKVNYVNCKTKVKVICKTHGEFEQLADNHIRGSKCPKCVKKHKPTTNEFIEKASATHNNFYFYNKVKYIEAKKKIIITCPKHGDFKQTPNNHLCGWGCLKCANRYSLNKYEFIEEAVKIHGNKYDYSKIEYIGYDSKIIILCKKHNKEFVQLANLHLNGAGCQRCAKRHKYSTDEFIEQANHVHDYKYNYNQLEYINTKTKIKIICEEHGEFYQLPSLHL